MSATRAHPAVSARSRRRPLAIATVDDVGRRRVETLLERERFERTKTTTSPDEFLDGLDESTVDVVLLLCERIDSDQTDAIHRLKETAPHISAVVVAGAASTGDIRSAVDAGADAVVLEPELEAVLAVTIRAVSAGQIVLPGLFREGVPKPNFSAREKQILSMVVLGFRNVEIARQLYLAESTVKSHLASAFRKLGVHSRKEATSVILDPDSPVGRGILGISESGEEQRLTDPIRTTPGSALLDSELRIPIHVVHRAFAHETVIIDLRSGRYHKVNSTGGRMLELLGRGTSPREAAGQLAGDFEATDGKIENDICEFAADLLARGLIELRDSAEPPRS